MYYAPLWQSAKSMNPSRKAKILWHCRRGMLELDIMLLRFAKKRLDALSEADCCVFEALLTSTDPELFSWLMGHEQPENTEFQAIVKCIQATD